ncbi:MAG: hypothetical protein JJT78_13685 [Leptospira sp.]|nr:hypothetical protein [Leptospira sp.]
MKFFSPINRHLHKIRDRKLTKKILYKIQDKDGTINFAPSSYNFLLLAGKLSFPKGVIAEYNNDGILIANEKNRINLYQVRTDWTKKKIRSVTFKTYKVLVFRFFNDVVYIGCKPKSEYDDGYEKSEDYGVKADIFFKWEYKTKKEPECIPLPEKIFQYHHNKGIDEILIDGKTLIAVDNIVEPRYSLKYDIKDPANPKYKRIYKFSNVGTYEHVLYGFLKGDYISLVSHYSSMGGGGDTISLLDKSTMREFAKLGNAVYEKKWNIRKSWRKSRLEVFLINRISIPFRSMMSDARYLYLLLESNIIAVADIDSIKKKSQKKKGSYLMDISDFTLYSPLEYKILGFLEIKGKVCVYYKGSSYLMAVLEYERMEHLMNQNLDFKTQVVSLVR